MANLCIIPARGGSKRIPRKNIKQFAGKPIIAHSIEHALHTKIFDEVMVSTDDAEIADVSRQFGASIPFFRSQENSNDFSATYDVLVEVLNEYRKSGREFNYVCCLYPTSPLTSSERILEGHSIIEGKNYDSVFPIVRYSYPIWRSLKINIDRIEMIWPENLDKRSQDLPASFHDAGQWYWFQPTSIQKHKKLWTDNSFGLEISELEAQDIDNETDWKLAELKYELQNSEK